MTFGLFGTGYWATETHAAGLVAAPDARFAGVWGRDPAKAEALADRYGVRAYADVDGLLADVDAVAIALPPQVQAGLATQAAAAGKHLLLDKPIALSMPDADALLAAVTDNGVASVVFVTNRYVPAIEEALRDAVATGGWHGGRATMHASIFRPGNPYAGSAWRREKGAPDRLRGHRRQCGRSPPRHRPRRGPGHGGRRTHPRGGHAHQGTCL
jgi:predicted dehydrogenase